MLPNAVVGFQHWTDNVRSHVTFPIKKILISKTTTATSMSSVQSGARSEECAEEGGRWCYSGSPGQGLVSTTSSKGNSGLVRLLALRDTGS